MSCHKDVISKSCDRKQEGG